MTKYVNNNGVSEMWLNIKNWVTSQLLGYSQTGHTHSASDITSGLSTVATSGSYNDLTDKPTIPTVNNATLTIQKNGTTVKTFTANASSNVTANITVPTKTSDLTNDSGFLTSHQDLSGYVPLSGSNQISGDLIPSTDGTVKLGSNSRKFSHGYIENLFTTFLIGTVDHGVNINFQYGANLILRGKNYTDANEVGDFLLVANDGSNSMPLRGKPSGTLTWGSKNLAMQEDVIPRSGGVVLRGSLLASSTAEEVGFGCGWARGGTIYAYGSAYSNHAYWQGAVRLQPFKTTSIFNTMEMLPDGTWYWSGQAVQLTSDQRLKQQISEIDDKLLDAWEDVNPVQFKYNDAVDQKGDNARLHTGYVVQQIDKACKEHGVDISEYGLYCHEEYPQETEEVEVTQKDGTKTKERKIIREANEHYSLRYTEALIVECAYLRKKNKELQEQLDKLSARLDKLESASSK